MSDRISFAWNKMVQDMFWFTMLMCLAIVTFIYTPVTDQIMAWARVCVGAGALGLYWMSFYNFYSTYCLRKLTAPDTNLVVEIGDRQAFIRQAIANETDEINSINHSSKISSFRRLALLFEDDVIAAVTHFSAEENEVAVVEEMRRILKLQLSRQRRRSYSDYYLSTAKCGFICASGSYFSPLRCPVPGSPAEINKN